MHIIDTLEHVAKTAEGFLQEALDKVEDLENERLLLDDRVKAAAKYLVIAKTYAAAADAHLPQRQERRRRQHLGQFANRRPDHERICNHPTSCRRASSRGHRRLAANGTRCITASLTNWTGFAAAARRMLITSAGC